MEELRPLEPLSENNKKYAEQICNYLPSASFFQACRAYDEVVSSQIIDPYVIAQIGLVDRFFFFTMILRRQEAFHPWLYERCREVEKKPDGHLDLWARFHYKSSFITYAGSLQEIAKNPNITIGIFSHTRPIAKGFLFELKQACEFNENLQKYYPASFWSNPRRQAPVWSLDSGLVMPRTSNPKEATIEAWGLVDGQPISRHYQLIIYDDVVTRDSIGSAHMIAKTTEAWELSRSLSTHDKPRFWMPGTRYSYADTYGQLIKRGAVKTRIYPATDTGTLDGKPVFLTEERWVEIKKETSSKTIACQQLQNPVAGEEQEFKPEWVRRYEIRPETLNVAILVDSADSLQDTACNTAMVVIGIDAQHNKYLLDGACHRMKLHERWEMLKALRKRWINAPGVGSLRVGYERFGQASDIQYFQQMMQIERNSFPIDELNRALSGAQDKDSRIRRLVPDHQNWRFFYPYDSHKNGETSLQARAIAACKPHLVARSIRLKNHEGRIYDLVDWFVSNEYLFFPATTLKDMLDAMSRVYDLPNFNPPQHVDERDLTPQLEEDMMSYGY